MKILGLHALTHDDDGSGDDCHICTITLKNNTVNPAIPLSNTEFIVENLEMVIDTTINDSYLFISSKTVATNQLFSRPPPSFIV